MARKTLAPVVTHAETAPGGKRYCTVTRLPGAPPRRAGRTWPEGQSASADLTPAEIASIQADPRYRLEVLDEANDTEAVGTASQGPLPAPLGYGPSMAK